MEKQLIEEMKEFSVRTYRFNRQHTYGERHALQAIPAYAALCIAEELHDLNNPQMTDAELREIMGAGNRTDQSIADAIAEQNND